MTWRELTGSALLTSKSSLSPSGILGGTRFGMKTLQSEVSRRVLSRQLVRMVPFIHALISPALVSEPPSPQGCRESTFGGQGSIMLLTGGCQLDSLRGRPLAILGSSPRHRVVGITQQAAGSLAMTLCQAPCGWQPPHCSPERAQRNGGLQWDLAEGADNHPLILCGLEGGQGMLSRGIVRHKWMKREWLRADLLPTPQQPKGP